MCASTPAPFHLYPITFFLPCAVCMMSLSGGWRLRYTCEVAGCAIHVHVRPYDAWPQLVVTAKLRGPAGFEEGTSLSHVSDRVRPFQHKTVCGRKHHGSSSIVTSNSSFSRRGSCRPLQNDEVNGVHFRRCSVSVFIQQ
jgi:hypothetical protein